MLLYFKEMRYKLGYKFSFRFIFGERSFRIYILAAWNGGICALNGPIIFRLEEQ